MTGGADKPSILADTVEAIIGAVYLDAGGDAATAFVLRLVAPLLADPERFGAAMDPKTSLQEIAARRGAPPPLYTVTESGPDHNKHFVATVLGRRPGRRRPARARARSRPRWPPRSRPGPAQRRADVPELPEVEVVRAGLAPAVTGARVAAVDVLDTRCADASRRGIRRLRGAR